MSARNYPDAMSATTLAASQNARVYLSEPTCVPQQTLDLMRGSHINRVVLIGGPAALSDDVARLQPC
ncbi:cell wall-binding repeat-containing protein [Agreia sp. PsM10]|uniref:cell wall-binding repeat-containing protein n=1 Tax=Agreia sp. PsM10 TaxID=3030533 RepID=UPI00263B2D3C|nr:cell wall-binding repeat-containing protein [Agreia sp. PsM10]MDN4638810.1 cell wall-binding repeat-containing protein [Agreia sp. PsM10]